MSVGSLRALKMNVFLLLTLIALAKGCYGKGSVYSCPDLCSCSFVPSGAEVECSQSSLTVLPVGLPGNTTRLSIQNTNLSAITATHLSAVPLLTNLQLYHTSLDNLPSDLLKDSPHLNTLDLTGNRLVRLPPNVFHRASLQSLVLKDNLIEKADPEWFPHNSSVTWLDLSQNHLTSVPADLLQRLPHMRYLDLSNNNLQGLNPDSLNHLHHLVTLNLVGNKLTHLEATTFTRNLKLTHLLLQQNQIQELPANLLQGLRHLQLLLLDQNQLQHLPPGLFDDTNSSFRVILSLNPWACDERLEYLWKWLTLHRQNVIFVDEVTCSAPEILKNRQVVSLTDTELSPKKNNMTNDS